MLCKENTLSRKWERQIIVILPFYARIRGQTLLTRLLTVPYCLIHQDWWLCTGEESRLLSEVQYCLYGSCFICCKSWKQEWMVQDREEKVAYMVKAAKYFLWKQDLLLDSDQYFNMVWSVILAWWRTVGFLLFCSSVLGTEIRCVLL